MPLTNKKNIARSWVKAVEYDDYDKVGDFSVTDLIKPIQVYYLCKRYSDSIIEDVSDRIWMTLGSAVHDYLHKVAELDEDDLSMTEQRIVIPVLDKQVSMKPDRFEQIPGTDEYHLRDFKITTVWKAIKGISTDWVEQTNMYAYGLRKKGINVTQITIEMLLRDWSIGEYMRHETANYPDVQIQIVSVDVWDDPACEKWLEEKVQRLIDNADVSDCDLPPCTIQERWGSPDMFAVKSIKSDGDISQKAVNGGSRFNSRTEATAFINNLIQKSIKKSQEKKGAKAKKAEDYHIEFRAGHSKRCEYYCAAKEFCHQYLTEISPAF